MVADCQLKLLFSIMTVDRKKKVTFVEIGVMVELDGVMDQAI